jgi:hypothetical protein
MLTVNARADLITGSVRDDLSIQTNTSVGVAETEQNALTVTPDGTTWSAIAVTITTPAGNEARISRKSAGSMPVSPPGNSLVERSRVITRMQLETLIMILPYYESGLSIPGGE